MTSDQRAHNQRTHIRSSGKDPPFAPLENEAGASDEDKGGVTIDVGGLPPKQDSLSVAALAVMPEIGPHVDVVLLGKAGPPEVKVVIDNGATPNFCEELIPELRHLAKAFDPDLAKELPPHRPEAMAIEFEKDAKLPFKKPYMQPKGFLTSRMGIG